MTTATKMELEDCSPSAPYTVCYAAFAFGLPTAHFLGLTQSVELEHFLYRPTGRDEPDMDEKTLRRDRKRFTEMLRKSSVARADLVAFWLEVQCKHYRKLANPRVLRVAGVRQVRVESEIVYAGAALALISQIAVPQFDDLAELLIENERRAVTLNEFELLTRGLA